MLACLNWSIDTDSDIPSERKRHPLAFVTMDIFIPLDRLSLEENDVFCGESCYAEAVCIKDGWRSFDVGTASPAEPQTRINMQAWSSLCILLDQGPASPWGFSRHTFIKGESNWYANLLFRRTNDHEDAVTVSVIQLTLTASIMTFIKIIYPLSCHTLCHGHHLTLSGRWLSLANGSSSLQIFSWVPAR